MPILLSQIVMKPVLCAMAVINVILLGACGYLLLFPAGGSLASISRQPRLSAVISKPDLSVGAVAEEAAPDRAQLPPSSGPGAPLPGSVSSVTSGVAPATIAGQPALTRQHLPSAAPDDGSIDIFTGPSQPIAHQVSFSETTHLPASFNTAVAAADASADVAPPAISVPLAFTTSAEGATPSQAAALGRLQSNFADDINGQHRDPNDPAYANAWQAAQTLSDLNYKQQFGAQAFIQQQLAQVHGAVQ